ncbi:sulfotransferase family protein [Glaciecola siphonariae]|uniref:Sulfotransferase family protein n=1 Tax=Glaciecola siphonariae TaxID=521012 RepID=A0ABV9LU65_9ALTE
MVNLHIIGAQKAGTTALAHFIAQHQDIYVLDGKEAHVFDNPQFLKSTNKMLFAKDAIAKRMRNYQSQRYVCDATPVTWYQRRFLTHCFNFNPSAKFIVILRDPVERALSHYKMSRQKDAETKNALAAFLSERSRLIAARGNWQLRSPLRTQSYLSRGRYSKQLKQLFDIVPRQQVLVLFQEDLAKHHQATLNKVFAFLDVDTQTIAPERVFESDKEASTVGMFFAKYFARLYYVYHGESKSRWLNIISDN